jgi:hypothetical protein
VKVPDTHTGYDTDIAVGDKAYSDMGSATVAKSAETEVAEEGSVGYSNPFISILYFKVSFACYLLSILIALSLAFFAVGISLAYE